MPLRSAGGRHGAAGARPAASVRATHDATVERLVLGDVGGPAGVVGVLVGGAPKLKRLLRLCLVCFRSAAPAPTPPSKALSKRTTVGRSAEKPCSMPLKVPFGRSVSSRFIIKARENSPFSLSTKQNGPVFQNRKTNAVFLFCFSSAMVLLAAGASPGAAPCNTPPLHLLPPFNPKAGRAGWRGQIKSCRPARRKLYHCGQKAQRHGLVSKSFVLLAGKTMISRSQRTGFARPPRRSRERERETRGGAVR